MAEDIRPCIRCLRCLGESINLKGHRTCTVNPQRTLFQTLPESDMPKRRKKVVVAGGGPAGLQAANELALKGHEVVLFEKEEKLGGRLSFADHVGFKQDLRRYREYLIRQVGKRENVKVCLGTAATRERIEAEAPDALVVAVGAPNFYPPIPGADLPGVIHGSDLFGQEEKVGRHAVIIGGGAVGCEATIQLHTMGREVDLVEMGEELMAADKTDYPDQREFTLYYVNHEWDMDCKSTVETKEKDTVHIHLSTRCIAITPQGVQVEDKDGNRRMIEADTVILATGLRPDKQALRQYEGLAHDVLFIGDCQKPGCIYDTSTTGYYAAVQI